MCAELRVELPHALHAHPTSTSPAVKSCKAISGHGLIWMRRPAATEGELGRVAGGCFLLAGAPPVLHGALFLQRMCAV
jgi:hypothetical protein